jgi:hypothetical protein
MRKAIIIEKPDWSDYESARAKFKSITPKEGQEVILVSSSGFVKTKHGAKVEAKKPSKDK